MLPVIFLSSLMAISSSSWFMLWILMEINSLSLCSTMFKEKPNSQKESQSAMLYLVIQLTSSILLISSVIFAMSYEWMIILSILCLMMKAGMWPLHLWYVKNLEMMEMETKTMKIMMTWQKIIPFILLMSMPMKMVTFFLASINLISPMSMLKKNTPLKPTLILSSMNNNSWFFFSVMSSVMNFIMFFVVYSLSLLMTLSFFKTVKTKTAILSKKMWENMLILGNMGSVPPFPMFVAKILIVYTLLKIIQSKEMITLMIIMSCIFLYFYSWSVLNFLMKSPTKTQLMKKSPSLMSTILLLSTLMCITAMIPLGLS